jgi:predicted Zn-dependent peptidase
MLINKKSITDFSGFYIVYKGSTLLETPENYGVMHLLEHLKCKAFENLYDTFDRYSISWNAYTDANCVVFHMTGLDEYVYKYRHDLLEAMFKFKITKKQFDNELKVVIQEYRDCFQDQDGSHYYNLMREKLGYYGPIGKLQALKSLKYDDVMEIHDKYLLKPSMIINVSKNSEFTGYDDFAKNEKLKFIRKDDKPILEKIAKFDKVSIIGSESIDGEFTTIKFINKMLAGSLKSPLVEEIREKRGLTYGVSADIYSISDTQGFLTMSMVTDDDKVDESLKTFEMVLSNPKKYLTEERFNLIKEFYAISFKKKEINLYNNVNQFIIPDTWNLEKALKKLTYDDVLKTYEKYFKFDKFDWDMDNKK